MFPLLLILSCILFVDLSKNPPGTLQVGENLFWDKTEISNRHYAEYLKWLLDNYGEKADTLHNAMPDLAKMADLAKALQTTPTEYLTQYKFGLYPVVCVSYKQAKAFCKWRSDRIYTWLNRAGAYGYIGKQHSSLMFMVNRSAPYREKTDTIRYKYPEYRLPTPEEWIAVQNHKSILKGRYKKIYPLPEYPGKEILNFFDNVSEITSTLGTSMGGNYKRDDIRSADLMIIPYDTPADWLGFRCVCSLKNTNEVIKQ